MSFHVGATNLTQVFHKSSQCSYHRAIVYSPLPGPFTSVHTLGQWPPMDFPSLLCAMMLVSWCNCSVHCIEVTCLSTGIKCLLFGRHIWGTQLLPFSSQTTRMPREQFSEGTMCREDIKEKVLQAGGRHSSTNDACWCNDEFVVCLWHLWKWKEGEVCQKRGFEVKIEGLYALSQSLHFILKALRNL